MMVLRKHDSCVRFADRARSCCEVVLTGTRMTLWTNSAALKISPHRLYASMSIGDTRSQRRPDRLWSFRVTYNCCQQHFDRSHSCNAVRSVASTSRKQRNIDDRLYTVYATDGDVARRRFLVDVSIGETFLGTVVQTYYPGGVSVDVGLEADGFLETEELRDPMDRATSSFFKPGHRVEVRLLDKQEDALRRGLFHLTARSGDLDRVPRYVAVGPANIAAFEAIPTEEWFHGEVTLVSDWAVFVKVLSTSGNAIVGILHKDEIDTSCSGPLFPAEGAIRGHSLRVRILRVEPWARRVLLTMKAPQDVVSSEAKTSDSR